MTVVAAPRDALGDVVDVAEDTLEAARADRSGHRSPGRPLAVVHLDLFGDLKPGKVFARA